MPAFAEAERVHRISIVTAMTPIAAHMIHNPSCVFAGSARAS